MKDMPQYLKNAVLHDLGILVPDLEKTALPDEYAFIFSNRESGSDPKIKTGMTLPRPEKGVASSEDAHLELCTMFEGDLQKTLKQYHECFFSNE